MGEWVAEMERLYTEALEDSGHTEYRAYCQQRFEVECWEHWSDIHAVLKRQAELEEALVDLPVPVIIDKLGPAYRAAWDVRNGSSVILPSALDALKRLLEKTRERQASHG